MDFFDEAKLSVETSENSRRVEVRPNRTVFCRRSSMSVSAKLERDDISSSSSMTNILFVHGSCAASSQYDDLIRAMSMKLLETQEQIQSYPKISKINCYSYDQLGCAESKHPASDWESFSSSNLLEDLRTIVKDGVLANSNKSSSLFLVGHSHGCSQVIQLVNSLSASDRSRIKGVILISGALKDGPGEHAKDGGHWIFKFVPMFLLRKMQPSLSQSFFQAAVHPKHRNALKERALNVSDTNDMMFCKAFYRQQATSVCHFRGGCTDTDKNSCPSRSGRPSATI